MPVGLIGDTPGMNQVSVVSWHNEMSRSPVAVHTGMRTIGAAGGCGQHVGHVLAGSQSSGYGQEKRFCRASSHEERMRIVIKVADPHHEDIRTGDAGSPGITKTIGCAGLAPYVYVFPLPAGDVFVRSV